MLISVEDITIRVGNQSYFNHSSWVIEKKQPWAITGKNGSGKTVLARALCRKQPLIQGRIRYFFEDGSQPEGRSFLHPDEILIYSTEAHQNFLRRFAEYHQARWQSTEDGEVPLVSSILERTNRQSVAQSEKMAEEGNLLARVIDLLNLGRLLTRKIHTLSHGESRKVFLASLLMRSPKVLILDDPFTGLDVQTRDSFSREIELLIRRGDPQILFISARLEDIPEGITHLLIVEDGRILTKGERAGVVRDYPISLTRSGGVGPQPGFQKNSLLDEMVKKYSQALKANPVSQAPVIIDMQDVSIAYAEVKVLRNIYWTVRQAERWALVGANGAGKSTLLSLVMADNPQSYRNTIRLFGKERGSGESIWEIKRNIGWVSPELQIYYSMNISCMDVVCSGYFDSVGLFRRCSVEQSAFAVDWLSAFGLASLADISFSDLSAGQQRLVLLARALVKNPPLLVLDEPCQGLDNSGRRNFIDLLDWLCAVTPLTLVYVTHDKDEIPAAITHQIKLVRGEMATAGIIL